MGGEVIFSGTLGAGDGFSDRGNDGTGGVAPSVEISMRGFAGIRERETFEAALPGRDGRMNEARGASSESSEDESDSSESLSLALDLLLARSGTLAGARCCGMGAGIVPFPFSVSLAICDARRAAASGCIAEADLDALLRKNPAP